MSSYDTLPKLLGPPQYPTHWARLNNETFGHAPLPQRSLLVVLYLTVRHAHRTVRVPLKPLKYAPGTDTSVSSADG